MGFLREMGLQLDFTFEGGFDNAEWYFLRAKH